MKSLLLWESLRDKLLTKKVLKITEINSEIVNLHFWTKKSSKNPFFDISILSSFLIKVRSIGYKMSNRQNSAILWRSVKSSWIGILAWFFVSCKLKGWWVMKYLQFTDHYPQNAQKLLKKWLNTQFWSKFGPLPPYNNLGLPYIKGKTYCSHHHSFDQLDASNYLAKTKTVLTSTKATILLLLAFAAFLIYFSHNCYSYINPWLPCSNQSHYSNFGLKLLFCLFRNQMISWVG